jgi:hypothetical protein
MTESNYDRPIMYVTRMDAVLNRWFTTYENARASLESEGGYLLPYKNQFFVTLSEGIRELGLDPEDADWDRIGFDRVRPGDTEAWQRLKQKRELTM